MNQSRLPRSREDVDASLNFRRLFEATPGLFLVLEVDDYRIVAASDAFLHVSRRDRNDLIGHLLFEAFVFPSDSHGEKQPAALLRESLERVKSTGEPHEMPIHRHAIAKTETDAGEQRYWRSTNTPLPDDDGRITHIIHRTEDITELLRLEQAEGEAKECRLELAARAEEMEADVGRRARELQRLNEHLQFAQHVANMGSWEYNVADGSRRWSDEVYRILGIRRGEMPETGDTVASVVHPDDRAEMDEARQRALKGEINSFEHRIVRPGGELRYVRERAELVCDTRGQPVRLFGTIQDITEQKEAEQRLRQSERLLQIAGKMARLGAWELNVVERRVMWSEEVSRIYELPPREGINFDEGMRYVAAEWQDYVSAAVERCIRDGTPYDIEFAIVTAKGRRAWVRTIGHAVHDAQGNVVGIQGALQDITRKREAEAEVHALSERLTETLENISDGFGTLDNHWRVTYVNRQAERILKCPREELLGRNVWETFPELRGTRFERMYRVARDEARTVHFEQHFKERGVWFAVSVYPAAEGLAVYFRDITRRRELEAAHRDREAQTRLILENSLDAVVNMNDRGEVSVWNPQAEKVFGWKANEAVGRHLHELIIPVEYRDAHRRGLDNFLRTGDGVILNRRVEVMALHRDGHEFPVELAISPIQSGNRWIFSAMIRDITERKKNEWAVQESEERFRTVARVTTDTVWDWDLSSDSFWWSEGIERVFGYRKEDLVADSSSWKMRIHPEDRERVVDGIQRVIESGADEWQDEYRFCHANGSVAHVMDRGFVIRDPAGHAIRMIGAMNDVTSKKGYELRLARQSALLDKAREAIIVLDLVGRVTYWNKAAEQMYGWSSEEALGRYKYELLHESADRFNKALHIVREHGEWTGNIEQKRRDGETLQVEVAWSLVTDDKDRPTAIFSIINDISERLHLEEQLRQSQRLESVGQLTGGVAHDFNNLLTVILGNSELLADQLKDNDRLRKLAEMCRGAAQRGSDLTHRLLAFARRQALAPKVSDINELVIGMEALLRHTLPENIDLETIPSDDAWPAYVDPSQLEAVLLNLAINAKDAMPGGGLLTIETDNVQLDEDYAAVNAEVEPGCYVMIAVTDSGTGIPEDVLGQVFDPFFTTKEKGKGTGLGLSMAYGFAKQSGGHIKIYSEDGQGTSVKLYLPRAEKVQRVDEDARTPAKRPTGHEAILVVEDDELVRQHAADQLTELGYRVVCASDGNEAMEILRQDRQIDLLFTDVIMPGGMNGPELARKALQRRPELKVLYTSGYTENAIVHNGHLDEGVQLLQKPYRRAELANKIRDVLNS